MQYHRNGSRPDMSSFALDNDDLPTSAVLALVNDCWKDNPSARPAFKEVCIRLKKIREEALVLPVSSAGMPQPGLSSQSSRNQLQNMLKVPLKQNTLVGQRLSVEKRNTRSKTMVTASALATESFGSADRRVNNASSVKSKGSEPLSGFRGVIEHNPTSASSDERAQTSSSRSSSMLRTGDAIMPSSSPAMKEDGRHLGDGTGASNSAVEDTDGQTWEFPLALYHEFTWHVS